MARRRGEDGEAPFGLIRGTFLTRLNRFVAVVDINGREEKVYVPNTGRLAELAIPGEPVLLAPSRGKYPFKLLYFFFNGRPVFIDSTAGNDIFGSLLARNAVPAFRDLKLIRREPCLGKHRFDFLFSDRMGSPVYCELKSCTLAWRGVASFPDAVSSRAGSHVEALAGTEGAILVFLILHENVRVFVPNFHTDYEFYKTLRNRSDKIHVLAYSVLYDSNLCVKELIPVEIRIPSVQPCGLYCIVYRQDESGYGCKSSGIKDARDRYYVRTGCDADVFTALKRARRNEKIGGNGVMFADMRCIGQIPVVGENLRARDLHDLLIGAGGLYTDEHSGPEGECVYTFKENPLHNRYFWDGVLEMRYARYRS